MRLRLLLAALLLTVSSWATGADWVYTTRPGDNLWDLSAKFLERGSQDTAKLQKHNSIADPYHIRPGTRIRFPVDWLKLEPASATVVNVEGEATFTRVRTGTTVELAAGTILRASDQVATGPDSSITIEFADGSRLLVQQSSEVVMDSLSAYGETGMVDTRMRVQSGRVASDVTPAAGPGSRFEITTPAAIAAVRGTQFRIGSDSGEREVTRAEVVEGEIGVAGGGKSLTVPAGFGLVSEAGQAPGAPRELLPAPDVLDAKPVKTSVLLEFNWQAVAGAQQYRAQLFGGADLDILLLDNLVSTAKVQWDAPEDARYVFQVRAIDEVGLEGLDAVHEFELDARPVPPSLLGPANGAAMHGDPPELWWSVPETSASFKLQLARDEAFTDVISALDGVTSSRHQLEETPPPAEYYWRLASVDDEGNIGPYGAPFKFRIQAVPDPVSTEAEVSEAALQFVWSPAANAVAYEFQLARDEDFEDLLIDESQPEPGYALQAPLPKGVVYFRARGVSDEGVRGEYSPTNRVDLPTDTPYWLLILLLPLLAL